MLLVAALVVVVVVVVVVVGWICREGGRGKIARTQAM